MSRRLRTCLLVIVAMVCTMLALPCFVVAAVAGSGLTAIYSGEPVYEIGVETVQPEYEGKMVRVEGRAERIPDPLAWRAKLGAYEVCFGTKFGMMYTKQSNPDEHKVIYLVGKQSGDRIIVWHHFYDSRLAWKLCTHKCAIYTGESPLDAGIMLMIFVGAWALGGMQVLAGMLLCKGRLGFLPGLIVCVLAPLLYLAALRYIDFSIICTTLNGWVVCIMLLVLALPTAVVCALRRYCCHFCVEA